MEGVMIGLPCADTARYSETYESLMGLHCPGPMQFIQARRGNVALGLNEITRSFLASPCEWLFIANDDNVYPPDTITRLLAHDKDIITGLCLARRPPFTACIYEVVSVSDMSPDEAEVLIPKQATGWAQPIRLGEKDHGLIRIAACGGAALLIRRRVVETLADPWWELARTGPDALGEDLWLCKKARDAGFEIWCDLDAPIGHLSVVNILPYRQASPAGVQWGYRLNWSG